MQFTKQRIGRIIKNVQQAQTQPQIASALLKAPSAYGFADTFTEQHYQCQYSKGEHQWVNSKSKKPADLNDTKTMILTALRYLAHLVD